MMALFSILVVLGLLILYAILWISIGFWLSETLHRDFAGLGSDVAGGMIALFGFAVCLPLLEKLYVFIWSFF